MTFQSVKIVWRYLSAVSLLIFTILWISSYTHYTSLGIDHDIEREHQTLHVFARIRWTGHGSIWIGYGSQWKQADSITQLEKFDLAGVFFRRATQSLDAPSFWNRVGFWFIRSQSPQPTFWVGIPSWLPVLVLGWLLFWWLRPR